MYPEDDLQNLTANQISVHSNTVGGLYLCAAMFMAAGIDIAAKLLTEDFGTTQIVLLRVGLSFPLLFLICWQRQSLRQLLAPEWGWQLYRGLLATGANFGFFYSLIFLDLVSAVLLAYIAPVLIVLAAQPILGERVGLQRWCGVIAAFIGVLLIVRPTSLSIHPAMLAVLFSALCWALLSITNRQLRDRVDAGVLAFYTAPISGLVAWALLDTWVPPNNWQWTLFVGAALCGAAAHFFTAMAYSHGQAATIAPLEYSNLLWSALAGWFIWATLPGQWVWLGGACIIAGGYVSLTAKPALASSES